MTNEEINIAAIAQVCYEANRAYCVSIGDNSFQPWAQAPEWQKQTNIKGVMFIRDHPNAAPSASHDSWMREKVEQGWVYGEVKDPEAKTHPAMLPYDQLPVQQRSKDYIFGAIVRAMLFELV